MDMKVADFHARHIELDDGLIRPYGGRLVQAFVPARERPALTERLASMVRVPVSDAELLDLEMIASGAMSPLTGFMTREAYASVLANTALPDGRPWGLPVTLAVSRATAATLTAGAEVALAHGTDVVGVMRIDDIYDRDAETEARVLGATSRLAARSADDAAVLIGGPIALLAARGAGFLQRQHLWPLQMRGQILQHGWVQVAVPHVAYPWRRTHEYLLKCVLEYSDALVLHEPAGTPASAGPLPTVLLEDASRMLIEGYFPVDRVLINPMPADLHALHPRAVLQHAILSQNYGASLFFVPECAPASDNFEAVHGLFAAAARHGLEIRPVFMPQAFHCEPCGGVATGKSCPHDEDERVEISDEEIAARLLHGEGLSPLVTRPEIARALARGMADRAEALAVKGERHIYPHASEVGRELRQSLAGHKAAVLWMTGLSGSGKSTIAHRLERDLLLSGHRVFVVDGDTLRHGLNRDLGFSEADRRENLRRAAEVVKVMVEAGLIVIASFISPFRAERQLVREVLGMAFHEVFVDASLEACEDRDPKGLYKRARAGQIPQFTGISSPYEAPENPDARVDTTVYSVDECVHQLRDYLDARGILRASRCAPAAGARAGAALGTRFQ